MKIGKNKVCAITYDLTVGGEPVESCTADRPLEFIFGTGSLLKVFEDNIEELAVGEGFEFTLSPAEAYGEFDPQRVVDLPKSAFVVEGKFREDLIVVGSTIPLMTSDGKVLRGVITGVKAEAVTVDLNHPMAGKTLTFKGKVVGVREATEKELSDGLHGELSGRCRGGCRKGEGCGEGCGCEGGNGGCGESCGEGCGEGENGGCGESCGEGCGEGCECR